MEERRKGGRRRKEMGIKTKRERRTSPKGKNKERK